MSRDHGRWVKLAVTAAAIAIESKWEISYGEHLELGRLAWALPLLTSGYLWLAMDRGRDVAAAVGALAVSVVLGAVGTAVEIPTVALAVWTALLVASVVYRCHRIDQPAADDVAGDVEDQGDEHDDELELPRVVDIDRPPAPSDEDLEQEFSRRYADQAPMTVDEVHALRRRSRDADRAWHRRMLAQCEAAAAAGVGR